MAGTGWVGVSHEPVGDVRVTHQYDVTVDFQIAFDWGGYNYNGSYYEVWCNGDYATGNATFSVPSGGGNWVWERIDTRTFRVTLDASGQSKYIEARGYIATGVTPPSIDTGYIGYTLPGVEWQWAVSYDANGGVGAPESQTKIYGNAMTLSSQRPIRDGYVFLGWATNPNASSADYQPGDVYENDTRATLYAVWKVVMPSDPTGCSNVRNSDSKNTVSWTRGENADVAYSSIKIERSVDGGAWSEIASVSGSAISYADTGCAANHSYRYRVRASNASGYSNYSTSAITYNTPAAPVKIEASRTGEATVRLDIDNPANTAAALELQRSANGDDWVTVATLDGKVSSATDMPGGGSFYYRARNKRGHLVSEWSPMSNAVVTICAPESPTLVHPASGVVVSKGDHDVSFEWIHNAPDGSAQRAAQLRYSIDGGKTWTNVDVTGADQTKSVENSFPVNSTVVWGVRTKGSHENYGPWSENRIFRVFQAPTIVIETPSDGFVIEDTPVRVSLGYSDASGKLASAVLTITSGDLVVYERNLGTSTNCAIKASEWLPYDGESYVMSVIVRSSSSLSSVATRKVSVRYALPKPSALIIEEDESTGFATVVINVPSGLSSVSGRAVHAKNVRDGAGIHEVKMTGISYRDGVPVPDSPKQIKSATSAALDVCGKNIIGGYSRGETVNGVKFTAHEDGTVTVDGSAMKTAFFNDPATINARCLVGEVVTLSGGSKNVRVAVKAVKADGSSAVIASSNGNSATVKIPEGTVKLVSYAAVDSGRSAAGEVIRPQLEFGSGFSGHERRRSFVVPIELDGKQLRSLPDGTSDELRISGDGKAIIIQRVGSVTLDGSEQWIVNEGTSFTYRTLVADMSEIDDAERSIMCSHFETLPFAKTDKSFGVTASYANVGARLCFRSTGHESLEAFKRFLAISPVTVLYPLSEEKSIDLGSVRLDKLPYPEFNAWFSSDVQTRIGMAYTDGYASVSSVDLYRIHDGKRKLLGEGLSQGSAVVDKYAPLNDDYEYEAVTFADSGATNSIVFKTRFDTPWAYLYYGTSGIAKAKWNPTADWSMSQSVEFVHYAGREFPVAYMEDFVDEAHTVTASLVDRKEIKAFRSMMMMHEPIVAKLLRGEVFHAVASLNAAPQFSERCYYGNVSVSLTRIDGEQL